MSYHGVTSSVIDADRLANVVRLHHKEREEEDISILLVDSIL